MIPFEASLLAGRAFACLPGCGFCCTVSPHARADEEARVRASDAGPFLVRRKDGSLGLRLRTGRDGGPGAACAVLRSDRACGAYDARPDACRLFPLHVHAGRRVQVSAQLACPGVWEERRATAPSAPAAAPLADVAADALARVLAAPDAARMVRAARENYHEFDRRLEAIDQAADERALAAAFAPALPALVTPEGLAGFLTGLAEGNLVLEDAGELHLTASEDDPADLIVELAPFVLPDEAPALPAAVDRDLAWIAHRVTKRGVVEVVEYAEDGGTRVQRRARVVDALLEWEDAALAEAQAYLALLTRRDHTTGAAARVMDAAGYRVTMPSAFGRVLADAAASVMLRAGVAASARGADVVSAADAREAVAAADVLVLSQPTIGAVL